MHDSTHARTTYEPQQLIPATGWLGVWLIEYKVPVPELYCAPIIGFAITVMTETEYRGAYKTGKAIATRLICGYTPSDAGIDACEESPNFLGYIHESEMEQREERFREELEVARRKKDPGVA